MQNRLKIAMYLRLSKEDDRNTQESNSISCQRLLLKEYIEQNFRGEILSDEVCQPKACITGCLDGYTFIVTGFPIDVKWDENEFLQKLHMKSCI